MKTNLIILLFICALLGAIAFLDSQLQREKKEVSRLSHNNTALMKGMKEYKTKDSLNAATISRLEMTKRELLDNYCDINEQLWAMGIKLKDMKTYSNTGTATSIPIHTIVRDTVILKDTLKCISWANTWSSLSGCINGATFDGKFENRDSIASVVHIIPKQWLFFKWGVKDIRQDVVCKNPYTKITFQQYIELKK